MSVYGLFGYILLQTSTVKEFLKNLERYYPTFYVGAFFKISTQKDIVIIHYGTDHSPEICARHDNEWNMGFVVDYLRSHLGDIARPSRVSFAHESPDDLREIEFLFGQNLLFNQTDNQLVYKKSILGKKLSDSDPWMLKILRQQADKMLQEYNKENSLGKEIRIFVLENLEQGKANADDIARNLNLSLSTFKRKLIEKKIDFRDIKESVKNQLAKKMLSDTKTGVSDIAKKIGFSEQSSFTRFFIRCNTITPKEFRTRHLK